MRFGLIVDDVVVQVAPRSREKDGEVWVELPPGITNGCRRHRGEWTAPPSSDHRWDAQEEAWVLNAAGEARKAQEHRMLRELDFIAEMGDVPGQSPLQTLADQVDVVLKQFEAMASAGLVDLHPDLQAKLAKWREIKGRHPAPAAPAGAKGSGR